MMRRWPWSKKRLAIERLLVFTRYPEPGHTKTRLIPQLGAAGAAELHSEMVRHTLAWADDLLRLCDVAVEVHFAGGDFTAMRQCFGQQRSYRQQIDGDLGQRMSHACQTAFHEGATRVVVVGTDCPDLSSARVADAFRALAHGEVVLGPACDGGYYLLGLQRPLPELFRDIDWGTERVFDETRAIAQRAGLSVHQLAPLTDVDEPRDLEVWHRAQASAAQPAISGRLSIIIPALNEAELLGETLAAIDAGRSPDTDLEVLVVDGGSRDATIDVARQHGARVLHSERGRARQMNEGAAAATGKVLLFLHADTQLPPKFDVALRAVLADRAILAGAFPLAIDAAGFGLRLVEWLTNLRAAWRGLPYGDQAVFLPTWVFETVGGYPDLPIMEDFALMDYLRWRGGIALAATSVRTSARRWQKLGVVRTTLVNQLMIAGYRLGISPNRLSRWYRRGQI